MRVLKKKAVNARLQVRWQTCEIEMGMSWQMEISRQVGGIEMVMRGQSGDIEI